MNLFTKVEFKEFLQSKGISCNEKELDEILAENKGEFPEDRFDLTLQIGKSENPQKLRIEVDNTTLTILGEDDFENDSAVSGRDTTFDFDYTVNDFDFHWIEYLMETPHENQEEYLEFIERYFDDVREYAGMDIDCLDEDNEDYDVLLSGYLNDVSVSTKMIDRARELRKSLAKSK